MAEPEEADRGPEVARSASRVSLPETYLDLYRLAVEMADRISARRAAANSFFLAVQTALVALLGVEGVADEGVVVAGLVLGGAWWLLLRSYRKLNGAKFEVILEIEKRLPVALFADEWEKLKGKDPLVKKRLRDRYAELGLVEQVVPAAFAAVYLLVLVVQ